MSWYNDPYRYPLPCEHAALDDTNRQGSHTFGIPSSVAPPPYAPQPRTSRPNLSDCWPTAQNYGVTWDFENIPPTSAVQHDQRVPNSKRRKHNEAFDTAFHSAWARQNDPHTFQGKGPKQSPGNRPSGRDWDRPGSRLYDQSFGAYVPRHLQSTAPVGLPPLPGATQYENRQRSSNLLVEMNPRSMHQNSQCSNSPPQSSQSEKRLHRDHDANSGTPRPKRQRTERQNGTLGPPMGTQNNPLEIASSPERSPIAKSKKSKKKFYAVAVGYAPGVFTSWDMVEPNVKGFSGAKHRSFSTEAEARAWLEENCEHMRSAEMSKQRKPDLYPSLPSSSPPPYSRAQPQAWHETTDMGVPKSYKLMSDDFDPTATIQFAGPSSRHDPIVDPDPVLKPEQQKVVDLILQGHNVFYTGSAGCGKSTILKAFVKQLQLVGKRVKIVAPTNLAALNVGGVTTWSFAGWTPDSMKKPLDKLMQAAHGKEVWDRFDSTDVLVIDEISMVENLLFERLNHIMKASRGEKFGGGPFGGTQVVVTGDFCQLSPVKPFQHCIGCGWELERDNKWRPKEYRCENRHCREDVFLDIDKWAFRSNAWAECNFKHVNLTEIHRQSDRKFISILQKIRTDGVILKPHANILLNHTSETEGAIQLFARRDDVDRVNNENIAKLPAQAITYKCVDHFDWKTHHREEASLEKNTRPGDDGTLLALKDHRYEIYVHLKLEMRVVLQANLEPSAGLVNGTQGTIIDFEPFDEKRLPRKAENKMEAAPSGVSFTRGTYARYNEEQIKLFGKENKRQPWPVVRFDNGSTRTIFADCTVSEFGNEEPFSLLSRTQIPLMAGYAVTVHKSQGMTLDRVIVDLSRAFEPSQIYVALSRARSLKGLKVLGLPRAHLGGANEQVKEFFNEYLRNPPAQTTLPAAEL